MNGLIIGSLGIYLMLVGFKGNARLLLDYVQQDAPGFFPWAVVIAALAVLNENENTAKIAKPFIGLAILTFILSNFDRLKAEYDKLRDMALGASQAQPAESGSSIAQPFGIINGQDWTDQRAPVDQIPK